MKTFYIFMVVSTYYISCTFGNNLTRTNIKFDMCYSDSKHCIQCFQEISVISYGKPFPQEQYRIKVMDQLNRVRSQYAVAHRISNMKFTNWVKEFEALSSAMAEFITPVTECFDLSAKSADRTNYKILDFRAQIELDNTKTLNNILQLQMDNFTRQMLNSADMMAWNLNEFGCCYTFHIEQRFNLSTLLRCVLYNENRRQNYELKSDKMCIDCDRTGERCIELDWYQGLCIPNNGFNETRLRWLIEPTQSNEWHINPGLLILAGAFILAMVLLSFYAVHKMVFAARKNHRPKHFVVYDRPPSAPAYM